MRVRFPLDFYDIYVIIFTLRFKEMLMDKFWRKIGRGYPGESLVVLVFVMVGGGAAIHADNLGPVGVSLAHGLSLAFMIWATGGGHLNPAVTLGIFFRHKISAIKAISYIACQLVGAILGAGFLRVLYPISFSSATPALGPGVNVILGMVLESIFTGVLVWVVLVTAVDRKIKWAPLMIGLTVAGVAIVLGSSTGASINLARWFGPAIMSGSTANHWAYWLSPFAGAFAGFALSKLKVSGK